MPCGVLTLRRTVQLLILGHGKESIHARKTSYTLPQRSVAPTIHGRIPTRSRPDASRRAFCGVGRGAARPLLLDSTEPLEGPPTLTHRPGGADRCRPRARILDGPV